MDASGLGRLLDAGGLGQFTELLIFLAVGILAGWIAGTAMRGSGYGPLGNAIVGIIGSVIGGFLFNLIGISAGGRLGSIITATFGAALLLFIVGKFRK